MAAVIENMKHTTRAVLESYEKWEIEAIMAPRDDNCIHQILPMSLERPPRNNEEFRGYLTPIIPLFKGFTCNVDREMFDGPNRMAAVHLFSKASTPIGQHESEYAFFLTFNEDGTKVTRVEEMADSAYATKFFGQLREHLQKHGGDAAEAWANAVKAG